MNYFIIILLFILIFLLINSKNNLEKNENVEYFSDIPMENPITFNTNKKYNNKEAYESDYNIISMIHNTEKQITDAQNRSISNNNKAEEFIQKLNASDKNNAIILSRGNDLQRDITILGNNNRSLKTTIDLKQAILDTKRRELDIERERQAQAKSELIRSSQNMINRQQKVNECNRYPGFIKHACLRIARIMP